MPKTDYDDDDDDDEDNIQPRHSRRRRQPDDDDEEEIPRRSRKPKKRQSGFNATPTVGTTVGVGIIFMAIATFCCIGGLVQDVFFLWPPVLFGVGLLTVSAGILVGLFKRD
jgi:hypothetical protein